MDVMAPVLRPMEQLSHMTNQTPIKGTPTTVPLFQSVEGVFPGFADNRQIAFDEIGDTLNVHETAILTACAGYTTETPKPAKNMSF
jgi:hypothetical protein